MLVFEGIGAPQCVGVHRFAANLCCSSMGTGTVSIPCDRG